MKGLDPVDYELDEKQRSVVLTEDGTEKMERLLEDAGLLHGSNLYDFENTLVVHHLNQALRANVMFKRDIDYIVKDGKVVIIDEFTGRMMEGRRWSDGLHQAVEAKEGVDIEPENQTMASITFQNYFRLYPKLGGMTGTAATEAAEFWDIYKMNVVTIPTNLPVKRVDEEDEFYKNQNDKFAAIAKSIKEKQLTGQPVLVGTVSIEKSELLGEFLQKEGVKHEVLNARFHEQEAHIVAQAGRLGVVTIATNMAGRGTDIQLGGNVEFRVGDELGEMEDGPEKDAAIERIKQEVEEEKARVIAAGGLFVLGTERHESRRIDNQLRGRSGRQGDPGLSRFYLSLDDDLLRIFGPQTMFARLMNKNLEDGEAIVSPWISKAIETAQKKVEARNYDIRKQVVEYDDVMNDQRKVIYEQRADIMDAATVGDVVDRHARRDGQRHRRRGLPAQHLSRAVGHSAAQGAGRGGVRPAAADRRLAPGGSGRSGAAARADPEAGRRAGRGEGEGASARELHPDREEHPPPVARPSLEGASGDARLELLHDRGLRVGLERAARRSCPARSRTEYSYVSVAAIGLPLSLGRRAG